MVGGATGGNGRARPTHVSVKPNARSSMSFSSSVGSGSWLYTAGSRITWHVEHASEPSQAPGGAVASYPPTAPRRSRASELAALLNTAACFAAQHLPAQRHWRVRGPEGCRLPPLARGPWRPRESQTSPECCPRRPRAGTAARASVSARRTHARACALSGDPSQRRTLCPVAAARDPCRVLRVSELGAEARARRGRAVSVRRVGAPSATAAADAAHRLWLSACGPPPSALWRAYAAAPKPPPAPTSLRQPQPRMHCRGHAGRRARLRGRLPGRRWLETRPSQQLPNPAPRTRLGEQSPHHHHGDFSAPRRSHPGRQLRRRGAHCSLSLHITWYRPSRRPRQPRRP